MQRSAPHWDSNAAALRDYAATSLPVSLALGDYPVIEIYMSQKEIDKAIDKRRFTAENFIGLLCAVILPFYISLGLSKGNVSLQAISYSQKDSPFMFWLLLCIAAVFALYGMYKTLEPFIFSIKHENSQRK